MFLEAIRAQLAEALVTLLQLALPWEQSPLVPPCLCYSASVT